MNKKILLAFVLVVVVGAIVWLELLKPQQGPIITAQQAALEESSSTPDAGVANVVASTTQTVAGNETSTSPATTATITAVAGALSPKQFLASRAAVVHKESTQYTAAAEITKPTGWINAQPFTLASLIGKKVVLLDFWTYSCINCIRTIPYLNAWYAKYKDAGLVVIGLHTPEFDFEHTLANVQAAVEKLGIQYPVILDSNMGTWNAYQNLYWPNEYLINVDGFIVHNNVGEGNYNETERAIQAALAQRDTALGIPTSSVPTGYITPSDTIAINYAAIASPETYFGAERNGYLANGPTMTNGVYTLTIVSSTSADAIKVGSLYLNGKWDFEDQYATNQTAGATILYKYDAKNVYMVASAATPVTAQIMIDGEPITAAMAGTDVSPQGTVTFHENRLYNLINGSSYAAHTIELIIEQPGLRAYTFTFG